MSSEVWAMAQRYDQPRGFNVVSALFLLAGMAAIYGAVQWGPPHYRRWKAQGVVSETVNKMYPKRSLTGEAESAFQEELRQEIEGRLHELGIKDTPIQTSFTRTEGEIVGTVTYTEHIRHPLVNRVTEVRFVLTDSVSLR
jgi:hypothetical protein